MATAADILEHAAEIGDRDGWCQGTLADLDSDARCAIGLLQAAARELKVAFCGSDERRKTAWMGTYMAALEALTQQCHSRTKAQMIEAVPTWNDAVGRTWPEVRDAFLHAAKEIRNAQ